MTTGRTGSRLSLNRVMVTPSEAFKRKLPPIGFKLDKSGTAMLSKKFPCEACYLSLSRPQGNMEFLVQAYREQYHDDKTLKRLIESRFSENGFHPMRLGRRVQLEIAGITRIAREFVTGRNLKRRKWIAALVPAPNGGPFGLLIVMGLYIGSRKKLLTSEFQKHPIVNQLMTSFRLLSER
jgi:hypothetical protein